MKFCSHLALTMFFASRSTISSNPMAYTSMGLVESVADSLMSTKAAMTIHLLAKPTLESVEERRRIGDTYGGQRLLV